MSLQHKETKQVILVIENSIDVTGALKSIIRTSCDLNAFFDFEFIIPKNSRGRLWIERRGFQVIHELPMKELSRRLSDVLLYIPHLVANTIRLRKLIKRKRIDLIHVNDLYNLLPVMLRLTGVAIPYVCHIRFLPDRFPPLLFNFWLKLHFRLSEKIVVVSHFVKHKLPDHPKIIVIHNELPVEEKYPVHYKPRSDGNFTFLYLSNFIKGKGHDFALNAFAGVHQSLPLWKLRFVGGDMGMEKNSNYRKTLMEQANSLGIGQKTEWAEFTTEVELEYKQADIVLNFSESESFSITCLEALFYGRPLIATDCGGPGEIIDAGITGILVPNRDIAAMTEAMKNMATDKALRERISEHARKSVREKFKVENTSYRLKEVYDFILKVNR